MHSAFSILWFCAGGSEIIFYSFVNGVVFVGFLGDNSNNESFGVIYSKKGGVEMHRIFLLVFVLLCGCGMENPFQSPPPSATSSRISIEGSGVKEELEKKEDSIIFNESKLPNPISHNLPNPIIIEEDDSFDSEVFPDEIRDPEDIGGDITPDDVEDSFQAPTSDGDDSGDSGDDGLTPDVIDDNDASPDQGDGGDNNGDNDNDDASGDIWGEVID